MVKFSKYRIISEYKLVLEYYSGTTDVNDMIALRKCLALDKEFNSHYNFIFDFRDSFFDIRTHNLQQYNDYIKTNQLLIGSRFVAILTDIPTKALGSVFSIFNQGDLPMRVNFYNTMDGAVKWIDLSDDGRKYLEVVILEMKNYV